MRIAEQSTEPLRTLATLVDGIDVAMLSTRADDGTIVSRPIEVLALDSDGEFVAFTAIESAKVTQLTEHAQANLAFVDVPGRRFVSVRARARIDREPDTVDALWSLQQHVFFPGGKDDPRLVVLRLRVDDAAYWDGSQDLLARALDFARGLLSDEPADLGQHGILSGRD